MLFSFHQGLNRIETLYKKIPLQNWSVWSLHQNPDRPWLPRNAILFDFRRSVHCFLTKNSCLIFSTKFPVTVWIFGKPVDSGSIDLLSCIRILMVQKFHGTFWNHLPKHNSSALHAHFLSNMSQCKKLQLQRDSQAPFFCTMHQNTACS